MENLQGFILPIGFLVIFYLFAIRPQKKKEQQVRDMRNALRDGDEIVTIGGIQGKIVRAKEDVLIIEVGSAKTRLEITRWAVGSVVKKNESKVSKKSEESSDSKQDEE